MGKLKYDINRIELKCTECDEIKPYPKDFYNSSGKVCKKCIGARSIKWHKDNPIKVKEKWIRYKYNIEPEEYNKLFKEQNGLCAICKINKATHVDHCHTTERVRGLLCHNCNSALGLFKDSYNIINTALSYLKGKI